MWKQRCERMMWPHKRQEPWLASHRLLLDNLQECKRDFVVESKLDIQHFLVGIKKNLKLGGTVRGCQIVGPILTPHTPPSHELFREVDSGRGSPQERNPNSLDPIKSFYLPAWLQKNHCPCIFEDHLSTNPILSALHLEDPKSNTYVHFLWVNKQLIRISYTYV